MAMTELEKVRNACRISTANNPAINDELTDLIAAAKQDLGIAGVIIPGEMTEVVQHAINTYCKMNFGIPEDYDRLKKSYDEQKAQLSNATGYTNWEVSE